MPSSILLIFFFILSLVLSSPPFKQYSNERNPFLYSFLLFLSLFLTFKSTTSPFSCLPLSSSSYLFIFFFCRIFVYPHHLNNTKINWTHFFISLSPFSFYTFQTFKWTTSPFSYLPLSSFSTFPPAAWYTHIYLLYPWLLNRQPYLFHAFLCPPFLVSLQLLDTHAEQLGGPGNGAAAYDNVLLPSYVMWENTGVGELTQQEGSSRNTTPRNTYFCVRMLITSFSFSSCSLISPPLFLFFLLLPHLFFSLLVLFLVFLVFFILVSFFSFLLLPSSSSFFLIYSFICSTSTSFSSSSFSLSFLLRFFLSFLLLPSSSFFFLI